MTRLPDSPEDRKRRDEALRRIGVRLVVVVVPIALIGVLAAALGIPVWIVVIVCVLIAGSVLFEA
jgi:heme A synthase